MENLQHTLERCFESFSTTFMLDCDGYQGSVFMTIPLKGNVITVPTFVLTMLTSTRDDLPNPMEQDAIVVRLKEGHNYCRYTSVDGMMRYYLKTPYIRNKLGKLKLSETEYYYVTWGAVFDKDFRPIMMLMWELEKYIPVEESGKKFLLRKPILQIVPSVFEKKNALEKYISGKLLTQALSISRIYGPFNMNCYFRRDNEDSTVKVVIDKFDFDVSTIAPPSISTTNEELLGVALDNLEDMAL